ncbi:MAG: hypothetical protein GTO24_11595 [candidate division Zixibacteria bacterium]|nr:hypothetical protein [candidate division Zixibacteria bacterium]
MGDYYQDEGTFPPNACPNVGAIDNTLGVGISTLRYINDMNTQAANGQIRVQFKNIASDVDGNWLYLTPTTNVSTGAIEWTWGGSGMAQKYIPKE